MAPCGEDLDLKSSLVLGEDKMAIGREKVPPRRGGQSKILRVESLCEWHEGKGEE